MMNVLKTPSFFRPNSRPSSPAPVPHVITPSPLTPTSSNGSNGSNGSERASRPINRILASNFRRPSPAPVNHAAAPPAPLIQDGSYLEMLSLKLSEAISKALAQPTGPAVANEYVFGKRPIPPGRGRALGALIASELKATQDKPLLRRALHRALHRPLTVLLTNLSGSLLSLISAPTFATAPTVQQPNPNPVQVHGLAIASFIQELLEAFDVLDLGLDADIRGDGLKPIREGLVSLLNRIINPLFAAIRNELVPLLEALENPNTTSKSAPGIKSHVLYHSSVVTLQPLAPIYARALTRYASYRGFQATLATFLVTIVWRALVALAHRPEAPPSPMSSPIPAPIAVKKTRGNGSPPGTPPASRFMIKLPPSRPPSPPLQPIRATPAADARQLYALLDLFPRPDDGNESTLLAREVVDDAFEGLQALAPLLEASATPLPSGADSPRRLSEVAQKLELLATEVPLLIALPVLLQGGAHQTSVPRMIGLTEKEYRQECLSGFGRAEECAITVASRVLEVLRFDPGHPVVCKWLEMEIQEALGGG